MDIGAALQAGISALEKWRNEEPSSVREALQNCAAAIWENRAELPAELISSARIFGKCAGDFLADSYFSSGKIGEALEKLAGCLHSPSDPWLAPIGRLQLQMVSITVTGLQEMRRQNVR